MTWRTRDTGDHGDTLVEILATVAVLGIGVVGLLTALATHASTTGVNRGQAQANTLLVAAAEYVKGSPYTGMAGTCTPAAVTPVTAASLPQYPSSSVILDASYTVTYGPAHSLDGSTACDVLEVVPVTVSGNGFTVSTEVVKRP